VEKIVRWAMGKKEKGKRDKLKQFKLECFLENRLATEKAFKYVDALY